MSELSNMNAMSDDRLGLIYQGALSKRNQGNATRKTIFIINKCMKEIAHRCCDVAYIENKEKL